MTLITSISGIRGTLGGSPGENLTPPDLVRFVSAYGTLLKREAGRPTVVIGRDGRLSGPSVNALVVHTLVMMGINVVDLGLSTTPTVEMAVPRAGAQGGIILTASHNPGEWNALKFLDGKGEFISAETGAELLAIAGEAKFRYADVSEMGKISQMDDAIDWHVEQILALPFVDVEAIKRQKFHLIVDCINSTGAIAIPVLLKALGCSYALLNANISDEFSHNPEPLPAHLGQLMETVAQSNADMGIAVDPDVDRLAFVCEDGSYFGEEYTLVAAAVAVLDERPGPVVNNLSSTMALAKVAEKLGVPYHSAPVGEVNVVSKMKAVNAVIGGEGNGGVILPDLHYGRDALAGIAIVLSHLARKRLSMTQLKATFPYFHISKNKANLEKGMDVEGILNVLHQKYKDKETDTRDGVKILFGDSWVHLRKSNTEPIIRIYAEANNAEKADALANRFRDEILGLSKT